MMLAADAQHAFGVALGGTEVRRGRAVQRADSVGAGSAGAGYRPGRAVQCAHSGGVGLGGEGFGQRAMRRIRSERAGSAEAGF